KVKRHSALLRPLQVTRPAHPQVSFRDLKTISCGNHRIDALRSVCREPVRGHQHAVRLVCTTAHPTAQLMQLRESESLRTLNNHHTGIGYVNTHFNHGCCDHYMRLPPAKHIHRDLLVLRGHPPVNNTDAVLWRREGTGHALEAIFE